MIEKRYEVLDSPSELRLRIYGSSLMDLFLHGLQAMFECIHPTYREGSDILTHEICLTATHVDLLFIDFLAEALALSDIYNEAYFDARFTKLEQTNLVAILVGKKISGFQTEIKAVTHHDVHIVQKGGKFITDLLLDI